MRTTSGLARRGGMKSVTRTAPSSVSKLGLEHQRALRYDARRLEPAGGSISQRPWGSSPSSAAKQAPESKRGRQSQSIEPSRPTSAAVCRSPIIA